MLYAEHGKNLDETLKLGRKIDVTPIDTAAVETLKVKGAVQLATLVPLQGEQFGSAFLTAMIKVHTETLVLIDHQLLKTAGSSALKKHLTETRSHVAMRLEEATKMQGGLTMIAP